MFDNLKNLASLMGNAKELKAKFEQMQAELAEKTVEAESGAGAVRVVMNGKFDVMSLRMDKAMLGALAGEGDDADLEMVEELIKAAVNAAVAKTRDMLAQETANLTGGMNIPGLSNMMG